VLGLANGNEAGDKAVSEKVAVAITFVAEKIDFDLDKLTYTRLNNQQSPINAISRWLAHAPCEKLNLVAHGGAGSLGLGSGIDRQVLLDHAEEISEWKVKQIFLWSCNTGQDQEFIELFQTLSNAQVIASEIPLGQGNTLKETGQPALEKAIAGLVYPLGIIESTGNTTLTLGNNNYYYANGSILAPSWGSNTSPGNWAGWDGGGGGAGAINGWQAIAAETINGQNKVLWSPVGGPSTTIRTWTADQNWKEVGGYFVNGVTNPQGYASLEDSFNMDLDGNGKIGQPPVATAGTYTTEENQSITLNLANLASDSNGDTLTFSTFSGPAKGTISLDSAGNGTYAPTGFDSLPAGSQGTDSFTYSVTDGKSPAVTNNVSFTISGANDSATITANTFDSNAAGDSASVISFSESQVVDGKTGTDVFSVSDVDFGEGEFSVGTYKKTVDIVADGKGSFQNLSSSANRTVGTYSLDASAATNAVDVGATNGKTADLKIEDFEGSTGFASLAAGEIATASITLISEDGTATAVSNLTITGVNDSATITANAFDSNATGDSASVINFTESQVLGGKTGTDVFSISDVDFGEEEFSAGSFKQTIQIIADGKGSFQNLSSSASRAVGGFSLDAASTANAVDAGATTGRTADLNIVDSGGANGFASLAAGETATASITLASEDGTAAATSLLTITGANDPSGITSTAFKSNYTQSDFAGSPVITYADSYKVNDIDYGEQEFGSGKYNTSILIDSSSGRSGQAVGSFSIVSDGSNRTGGNVSRDAGSTNSDSADVVIAADGVVSAGQVFNLAAVLDGIPGNSYGVQLKILDNPNTANVNESKGGNYYYDLSDLTLGSTANGQIEVYRYKTDGDGNIIGGGWTASDSSVLSPTDPLRLISGSNSLAYGETATATLAGVSSEDGTSSSGPTTIKIVGENDAPIIDTSRKLNSFELYGTFTVAQMLGFVDPNKTLITDVDYGSMPESIAVTKLTPTGGFADADTGVLQRYNETTKEWEDIDTKNVSDAHKLRLRPSDLLRFNASAEAYVSAALDKGSSKGGGIFDVEFRAWDSAYESALKNDNAIGD